ncbi:MAG: hypothetical protein NWE93_03465 [Candidatus Bathyarchaeota archaeon]|nr:hypothetical protein [Candidatus Bathyarchaeota archaeon]
MNQKGQFSVIAALLVAVVLVAAVVTTYSAIRYGNSQEQPQILSAIDETNLGIKEILGFTVGYYGSVLKVTGNNTYAKQLATSYLKSGLDNIGDVRPEWGAVFKLTNLELSASWFTNNSYSQGSLNVNYNLTGLGIKGISYATSTRLNVQLQTSSSTTQAQLIILRDEAEPLINLGKSNLKLYSYNYQTSSWNLTAPASIASYANGTYVLDLPSGVDGSGYILQVEDSRGLMVVAASYTKLTSTLTWNSSAYRQGVDYVDVANQNIVGSHSNFAAQQSGPDGVYDTLTEQASGMASLNYYPVSVNLLGSTKISQSSGNITVDTQSNDGSYLYLRSYPSAFSSQTSTLGYTTKGASTQNIEDTITGSMFSSDTGGQLQSISVYLYSTAGSNRNAKVAIYSASDDALVAGSGSQTVYPGDNGWVTFSFSNPKPVLTANTNYVLVAWSSSGSGSVNIYYNSGSSNQGYSDSETFGTWPNPDPNLTPYTSRRYSIYCTYTLATQYTVQAELMGNSDSISWQQLTWAVDSAVSAGTASCTLKLYNSATGTYPSSGDGYLSASLGTSDNLQTQTITTNPTNYRNATTGWKILLTAQNTSASPFDLKIDLTRLTSQFPNYAVNLQEQWLSVNASILRQALCIKTGSLGSEPLLVQVLRGGSWTTVMTLVPNYFNNVSLAGYIDSSTLTIRFVGSNDAADPAPDSYQIDCVYIKDEPDIAYFIRNQQSSFTLEVLQNGTMRWLGQNLEVTTHTLPMPPIAVKTIHVNQTIGGVSREVPFQIEDWASNYQIPLGLTANTTVFSNRQMLVFQLNSSITDFTIWWGGIDASNQTAMAYINRYFSDTDTTLNNSNIRLQFGTTGFVLTSTAGTVTTTSTLMRINGQSDTTDPEYAYVITNGTVRDIVLGEAEYSGGITNCSNTYTSIIITLPAGVTYYTYQARLMFQETTRARNISDLCPVRVSTSISSPQTQTENGTLAGFPILDNSTTAFLNYTSSGWTPHHFSQLTNGVKGTGLIFTDTANQRLYSFNAFSGSTSRGSIRTSTNLIELLPVSSSRVDFKYAYDITWVGAVATFDGTTPICSLYQDTTPMGLWILAEYPPTLTVTPRS